MKRPELYPFFEELIQLSQKKKPCVLATITGSVGSTPQIPGCKALFVEHGLVAGTIGGGATEMAVEKIAQEAINSKKSGHYNFNLNHAILDLESPICGGGMNILIDASPEKHLPVYAEMIQSLSNRISGVLVTICNFKEEEIFNIDCFWITKHNLNEKGSILNTHLFSVVNHMANKPRPGEFREIAVPESDKMVRQIIFLETFVPLPQLIIAGAGHVGKALSHVAKLLDFEVTVWDDRPEYASAENLPDASKILTGTAAECFENINPESDTFIVIVTRGHKQDADVLKLFVGSNAAYIGMIGSRRKISQVRESFINKGWANAEQWNKIHSPIGLEIGSQTVQEIAISIAAQLVQVRNKTRNL